MNRTMKQQAGFTLIELIMVIVILGVLSAFALPRFADLGGEARIASLNGLVGTLRSSMNIAHAQQLADGGANNAAVDLEGAAGVTMIQGYPTADAAGIRAAAQISNDYTASAGGAAAGATVTFTLRANCVVTYTAATTTAIPTAVISDQTGC